MSRKAELLRSSLSLLSEKDRPDWSGFFWRNLLLLTAELVLEIYDSSVTTKTGDNE